MKTQFIHDTITFPGGSFVVDGNSKITRSNGTYAAPSPNAFSLPAASVDNRVHGSYCPGSTPVCRGSCYVRGLAQHAPDVYAAYSRNALALRVALLDTAHGRAAHALAEWIATHARGGFRWHVSGDVWHAGHAAWIVQVCRLAPAVPFWVYTRTMHVVEVLVRAENLAVNVSADRDNWLVASAVARAHGARITYLCDDGTLPPLPPGAVIFPDYNLRGRDLAEPTRALWWLGLTHEQRAQVCGADFFGQSESQRCGPCNKCLT